MSIARHNLSPRDGGTLPFPGDASASDLARVIEDLAVIGTELKAYLVTEELRSAQYRRVGEIAGWIGSAASSLDTDLRTEMNRQEGNPR